jgi:hypothetical protein
MHPTVARSLLTTFGAVVGAASFVPQLAPYQAALTFLAGALVGGALLPRPGDLARAEAATDALAAAIKAEK